MATGPITKTRVDALQCPAGKDREILWDDAVRGFGVIAFRNGGKVYVAQYRKDGRSRRTHIGDHGRLTPEEARKLAKVILGAVESGADPIAERRAAREVRTFKAVADDFLSLHVATKRKARTGDEYKRILQTPPPNRRLRFWLGKRNLQKPASMTRSLLKRSPRSCGTSSA